MWKCLFNLYSIILCALVCEFVCVDAICTFMCPMCMLCVCMWGIWKKASAVFFYFSPPYFLKTDISLNLDIGRQPVNTSDTVSDPSHWFCSHGWDAWHLLLRNSDLNSDPCHTARPVIFPNLNVRKYKSMMSRNWRNSLVLFIKSQFSQKTFLYVWWF